MAFSSFNSFSYVTKYFSWGSGSAQNENSASNESCLQPLKGIYGQIQKIAEKTAFFTENDAKEVVKLRQQATQLNKLIVESFNEKDPELLSDANTVFEAILKISNFIEDTIHEQVGAKGEAHLRGYCKPLPSAPIKKALDLTPFQENLEILIKTLDTPQKMAIEGVFRLSGSAAVVNSFNTTKKLDASAIFEITDVHAVAGVLKKMFRDMPVKLLDPIKEQLLNVGPKAEVMVLKSIVETLPEENKTTLKMLVKFLSKVAEYAEQNKMTPANLAICMAPNLFSDAEDMISILKETPQLNGIVAAMITNKAQIFN